MYVDKAYLKHKLGKGEVSLKAETQKAAFSQRVKESHDDVQDNPEKAFAKIERLVALRDRSVYEIKNRLSQARFSQSSIDDAIERALRCGFLDDRRFAESYFTSKLRAQKGVEGIVRDLKKFGIDVRQWEDFPDAFIPADYHAVQTAVSLLERKPPRAKNKRQAAYTKLIRDGYSSSEAHEAVVIWEESL